MALKTLQESFREFRTQLVEAELAEASGRADAARRDAELSLRLNRLNRPLRRSRDSQRPQLRVVWIDG